GRPRRRPSPDDARRRQDVAGRRCHPPPRKQFACVHNDNRPLSLQDNGRTALHDPNVRVRSRVSMANESFMSGYSVFSESAEWAPLTATTVATRNRTQLAIQEVKFVLLNNPPFRR